MICLIIPPSPFLLDERVFMSLGILKVAAALEAAGEAVDVLDLSGVANYEDAVRDYAGSHPDVRTFGLTATSPQLPAACRIAKELRACGGLRIILGGPHVTLVQAAARRLVPRALAARRALWKHFDVLVCGDGERAIFAAICCADGWVIDADYRGSHYWIGQDEQDDAPFPARHLVDVGSYKYQIDGVPALSLIAQLGCPFGCGFCAGRNSPMLRHIRTRSTASIIAEMASMFDQYGTTGFMFYDDELNVSKTFMQLLAGILALQLRIGLNFRLRGFIKAELFTDEQAAAMYSAGFRWILVGFESGAERILQNINKKATKADNTRCIEIAHRHGLKVKALMSLGHPGESATTVLETLDWLSGVKPDDFDITIITPYPGSPYYDEAVPENGAWVYTCKNGDKLFQDDVDYTAEADYYKGKPGAYVSRVWTPGLVSTLLVAYRDDMERCLRRDLGIPYNTASAAVAYEHSMGQTALPTCILRSSIADNTMAGSLREAIHVSEHGDVPTASRVGL
jgi:anaerobic magnesium-protoporphyrin IX monomethyl ester cyclase